MCLLLCLNASCIHFSHLNVSALLPEPEASPEESPSADEEQPASSAAPPAEVEEADGAGETAPAENGEKADEAADEAAEEQKEDQTETEKQEWVSTRELVCNSEHCDISLW